MEKETEESGSEGMSNVPRRKVLQAAGSLSLSQALVGKVDAAESAPYIGETHFVDAAFHHEGVHQSDYHVDGSVGSYVIDNKSELSLTAASPKVVNKDVSIALRGQFFGSGQAIQTKSSPSITVHKDINSAYAENAHTESEYSPPAFTAHVQDGETLIRSKGIEKSVTRDSTESISFSDREVELRGGELMTVTPVLRVRNHGMVKVYGREGKKVLPLNSEIPAVEHQVMHYSWASQNDPNVSAKKTEDHLIVDVE